MYKFQNRLQLQLLNLFLSQVMSLEEVERIMDETQEAIEYQRVRNMLPDLY